MGLRAKVLLPLSLAALLLGVAFVADGAHGRPALLPLIGFSLLLIFVVALTVEFFLLQPRERLKQMLRGLIAKKPLPAPAETGKADDLTAQVTQVGDLIEDYETRLAQESSRNEKLQQALREADERYVLAVRCASDGIWEWDLKADRMDFSPSWKNMLGFADDEPRDGRGEWRARIHPDDADAVAAALKDHLDGSAPRYEQVFRLRHGDGSYRWILSRGAAIRHASGKAYRVVGLDTDITRLKRIEKILGDIVEGTSGEFGEGFFRSLVRHFASALDVHSAFITECADQPPTRLRTLAFWSDDDFLDNFEYDLPGTPCETVIKEGRVCFIPVGVGIQFPIEAEYEGYLGLPIFGSDGLVIGHLAFLDNQAMTGDMLIDAVYRVFTSRAAAEMERKMAVDALHRRPVPSH